MNSFLAYDDPVVERTIADHMRCIVETIRSKMEPDAIILRGSFGRGEGSVVNRDGHLLFLSDYELDIATYSPFYRSTFKKLEHEISEHIGVQIGMRWVRPDFLKSNRVGPFVVGPAPITISLYECRYGSRVINGKDFIHTSPEIDASKIRVESGIDLLFNRVAESLLYFPIDDCELPHDLEHAYWINKTILACAEALLVLWGEYHYSYRERGRRFTVCHSDRLAFLNGKGELLCNLVGRATEFKLRPDMALYPDALMDTWLQVIPICDLVLRHLLDQVWNFTFLDYTEFPTRYLEHARTVYQNLPFYHQVSLKILEIYRFLRKGMLPINIQHPYPASENIYAVVPLLFTSWCASDAALSELVYTARKTLTEVSHLNPPNPNLHYERTALSQHTVKIWKNFWM